MPVRQPEDEYQHQKLWNSREDRRRGASLGSLRGQESLIGVEEGACSEQSKTIPRPLQISQTMLKPDRGLGAICDVFPAVMIFLRTKPSSAV
jgi:hypothetical protein